MGGKDFDEPPEISSIKKYVLDEFKSVVVVQVRDKDILISVPNASLANMLRLRSQEIKQRCQLDKKLVFRIGY